MAGRLLFLRLLSTENHQCLDGKADGKQGHLGNQLGGGRRQAQGGQHLQQSAVGQKDPDGAAAAAGLQVGDVITRIDGTEIRTMTDLSAAKKSYTAGDTARFTVVRGGQSLQITVTWGAEPDPAASASQNAQGQAPGGYGPYGGLFGLTPYYGG